MEPALKMRMNPALVQAHHGDDKRSNSKGGQQEEVLLAIVISFHENTNWLMWAQDAILTESAN